MGTMMVDLSFRVPARTLLALLTAGLGLVGGTAVRAQVGALAFAPPAAAMPAAPEIAARAYILQDLASRQTLAERQADQPLPPASLTKLMSAYLVFQALDAQQLRLDQTVPISERAWRSGLNGPVRGEASVGSRVRVDELIRRMAVHNANDATVALAEAVAGSVERFVERMNRQAELFGLRATHFTNPDGAAVRGHVSSARDLSVIAARLLTDYPAALPNYGLKSLTVNGLAQANPNLLLQRDPTVDGLQTGYSESGGYGLVATSRRPAAGGERRLISVVLGATSSETRAGESQKLLNWGYSAFDVVKLFDAGQPVALAPVWKGREATVPLGRPEPLVVVVPRGQANLIKTHLTRPDPLLAPLAQGQAVGMLHISLGPQPWQTRPLVALEAVPSAGWLGRAWDALRLGIQ